MSQNLRVGLCRGSVVSWLGLLLSVFCSRALATPGLGPRLVTRDITVSVAWNSTGKTVFKVTLSREGDSKARRKWHQCVIFVEGERFAQVVSDLDSLLAGGSKLPMVLRSRDRDPIVNELVISREGRNLSLRVAARAASSALFADAEVVSRPQILGLDAALHEALRESARRS